MKALNGPVDIPLVSFINRSRDQCLRPLEAGSA
jgi:hypothetical protein